MVLADILDELGKQIEAQIRELGGEATYVYLDVTQEENWRRAVELAEGRYSKLDVLANNAGITIGTRSIGETSDEEWDRLMAVNA